jgi:periplasmic copper chaperone A
MRRKQNVKRPNLPDLSFLLLMASTVAASAAPFDVTEAWFRSLPGGVPAGGYFTAQNNSSREVAIIGVQSDACGMLMMHRSSNKGGMSGMDMVDKVSVPSGGVVKFAPAGYHLMCERPRMKIGAKVPVSFSLSNGTTVVVAFQVRNAAGK